ncbi:UDP-Glycosyltransferase superfamily protein [Prunus dulcis]|uniref:UDP-Glycosyltransferase superfamily protein n=1 Tax=Prunus dulcis TaxID=3755 RepID=A0A4Y1QWH8_PRUDU|nr:UDP-Glycosyltransferase superfamily protein [Prunus dulcis]
MIICTVGINKWRELQRKSILQQQQQQLPENAANALDLIPAIYTSLEDDSNSEIIDIELAQGTSLQTRDWVQPSTNSLENLEPYI